MTIYEDVATSFHYLTVTNNIQCNDDNCSVDVNNNNAMDNGYVVDTTCI